MWTTCRRGHPHWGRHGAAGLLLADHGHVLLQLRARWAHQGGTWSIPGGALERGEDAVTAALREAREELGLDATLVGVHGSRVATCGGWTYETVLGRPHPEAVVDLHDHAESDGHRWVPASDVPNLRLHPAFAAAWADPDAVLRTFVAQDGQAG